MKKIACLIVDDEPLALDLLQKYVCKTPFLELAGECSNALQAMELLQQVHVDLLFLDIQMPELNGLELSRAIPKNIRVIFTTAFDQYAIEGFKVNALDYLLKPFNYEEFLAAALKAKEWMEMARPRAAIDPSPYIFVRSDYKQVRIPLNEVLYFEGFKDYIKIWLVNRSKPVMTLMSLKSLEQELPPGNFMRVHRSYIVALNKIQAIDRNHIVINDNIRILIAESYKAGFSSFINKRSIP